MPGRNVGVDRYLGHSLVLDAHTYDWMQKIRTGQYFPPVPSVGFGTCPVSANAITAVPFSVARTMTIDRLAIEVTVAAAAGSVARLGIYKDGVDCYPGALVLDAGTVLVDAVAVVAAAIDQQLTKGLYWLALISDGTPWLPGVLASRINQRLGWRAGDITYPSGTFWLKAFAYAALPDPFTAGGTGMYFFLRTPLKLVSLD